MIISDWQYIIREWSQSKGFDWKPKDIDTMLLRIHGEVTEASEAMRDNDFNGFAEEMADIFIRLVDMAQVMGVNLEVEVNKKHKKNMKRPRLHGRSRK